MDLVSSGIFTEEEIRDFQFTRIFNYFQLASIALLLYESCITFSLEVQLIWKRRWSLVSALYLATRYLPYLDNGVLLIMRMFTPDPSDSLCKRIQVSQLFLFTAAILLAEGILVLRTYAIWGKNRKIAWIFGGSLAFIALAAIAFLSVSAALQKFQPRPRPPSLTGCFLLGTNRQFWIAYLLATIFETAILSVTLYKVNQQRKYSAINSTLMQTVYRDGITFYIYILVVSLINIIVLNVAPDALASTVTQIYRAQHAILTARIILNIRNAGVEGKHHRGPIGIPDTENTKNLPGSMNSAAISMEWSTVQFATFGAGVNDEPEELSFSQYSQSSRGTFDP